MEFHYLVFPFCLLLLLFFLDRNGFLNGIAIYVPKNCVIKFHSNFSLESLKFQSPFFLPFKTERIDLRVNKSQRMKVIFVKTIIRMKKKRRKVKREESLKMDWLKFEDRAHTILFDLFGEWNLQRPHYMNVVLRIKGMTRIKEWTKDKKWFSVGCHRFSWANNRSISV